MIINLKDLMVKEKNMDCGNKKELEFTNYFVFCYFLVMIKNGIGGASTNKNGKEFEKISSIKNVFENNSEYMVIDNELYRNNICIGRFYNQQRINLLINLLNLPKNKLWSCDLYPDGALYIFDEKKLYISESKEQSGTGSVDFKPNGFPALKWKYEKLFSIKGITIKFCGVYSDYFKNEKFNDMFEYLKLNNISTFFNKIDLSWFDFTKQKLNQKKYKRNYICLW